MYDIGEIHAMLKERAEAVKYLGLEIDVLLCYRAFYEQHREVNGSNKVYLNKPCYDEKMQERYDFCIDSIDCLIEIKHEIKQNNDRIIRKYRRA